MSFHVLYEDNHVIVIDKPVNVPTQSDMSGDVDVLSLVKEYIKIKYNKPGEVYLGMVHRLDRPVGGVMVFARTSKAASRLTEAFGSHAAGKHYAAVVDSASVHTSEGRLEGYIKKDDKTYSAIISDTPKDGYKQAVLYYRVVCMRGGFALLDIDLKTGRHHQIRAQLAHAGMPIVGDHRYNPSYINANDINIALYAYSLRFPHPTQKSDMSFTNLPTTYPFDRFGDELRVLCAGVVPVYADKSVIIVDKPSGIEVAAADCPNNSVQTALEREFCSPIYPVHRIDATTTGLVTFARTATAKGELESAFSHKDEARFVDKYYTAKVVGVPAKNRATLYAYLRKDADSASVRVFASPHSADDKEIITQYTVIDTETVRGVTVSTLEVKLLTGRTHQIRAHLAYISCPLVGDDKYGDREANKQLKCTVPQLRATRVTFTFTKTDSLYYLNGKSFAVTPDT